MGQLFNARYEDGRIKAELWIDTAKAGKIAPDVLSLLQAGRPLELSTGLFLDEEPTAGTWQGEEYTGVVRNFRADHVALLPGGTGACSWDDGCGAPRLNRDRGDKGLIRVLLSKLGSALGLGGNEASHEDVRHRLQRMVDGLDTPARVHFVRAVYDDHFIYLSEGREPGLEPKLYQRGYGLDDNGEVSLSEEVTRGQGGDELCAGNQHGPAGNQGARRRSHARMQGARGGPADRGV